MDTSPEFKSDEKGAERPYLSQFDLQTAMLKAEGGTLKKVQ
jgi:hypothetical protein